MNDNYLINPSLMNKKTYWILSALVVAMLLTYFISRMIQQQKTETRAQAKVDNRASVALDSAVLFEKLQADLAAEKAAKARAEAIKKKAIQFHFFQEWVNDYVQQNFEQLELKQVMDLLLNFEGVAASKLAGDLEPRGFYKKISLGTAPTHLILGLEIPNTDQYSYWKYYFFQFQKDSVAFLDQFSIKSDPQLCYRKSQVHQFLNDSILLVDHGVQSEKYCSNYRQYFLLRSDRIIAVAHLLNFLDDQEADKKVEAELQFLNTQILAKVKYQVPVVRNGKTHFRNQRDLLIYNWNPKTLRYEPEPDPAKAYLAKMLSSPKQ